MPNTPFWDCPATREHLTGILLRGDRAAALDMLKNGQRQALSACRDALMRDLTARYLAGEAPFCQLTAVAQAASVLHDPALPPVACCGALRGNTSAASHNFMLMLLRAWCMPTLDLGLDVAAERFLEAVERQHLPFAVCAAFSEADADRVREIHDLALRRGLRGRFRLAVCGARLELGGLPVDCPEYKTAAVAGWVVRAWKG